MRRRATLAVTVVLVVAAVVVLVAALTGRRTSFTDASALGESARAAAAPSVAAAGNSAVLALLDDPTRIPVKGRAPTTGYSRAQFQVKPSVEWADPDGNHCDTRNDVLARDLTGVTLAAGSRCIVVAGTLHDRYTDRTVTFTRGTRTSSAVQIDHVVSLSDAWQTGAQALPAAQRVALANDPLNLLAVDGPTNEAKGDGDAATWLPPNRGEWCDYVARQVAVKAKWHLWMTAAEHQRIRDVVTTCPTVGLPVGYTGG